MLSFSAVLSSIQPFLYCHGLMRWVVTMQQINPALKMWLFGCNTYWIFHQMQTVCTWEVAFKNIKHFYQSQTFEPHGKDWKSSIHVIEWMNWEYRVVSNSTPTLWITWNVGAFPPQQHSRHLCCYVFCYFKKLEEVVC